MWLGLDKKTGPKIIARLLLKSLAGHEPVPQLLKESRENAL
jgi:hypothetical protein